MNENLSIPANVLDVFYSYLTSELIYFDGEYPIATPIATFYDEDKNSIVFSTSVSFYHKVRCMKQHPTVSLLYSKHEYSGISERAVVLVNGAAKIYEEDFEENNIHLSRLIERQRDTWKKQVYIKMGKELDSFIGRRLMDWYLLRILIEIIPHGIVCWKGKKANVIGSVDELSTKIDRVEGNAILAFMGKKYPIAIPVKLTGEFLIEVSGLKDWLKDGQKACLLFHRHNRYVKEISLTRYKGWVAVGDNIEFIPTSKFSFKQGGILNSIRFILDGKRRAKKFLKNVSK